MTPMTVPILSLFVAGLLYKVLNLCRYVRSAQWTGLPYVLTPALETEVWSYILTPIFRKVYHAHLLRGEGWPRWCRFMIKDWAFEDKHRAHDDFGEVFLVVSPEGIICYSADATTNYDVMMRKNEFLKPHDKYKLLEPYGPNVNTAEGKTYQFHVRITAPPFNDISGVNDLVWQETTAQTRALMKSWSQQLSENLQLDVAGVTLAVISLAGFGKRLEWISNSADSEKTVPPGYKLSFLKAMTGTTKNLVAILLLPAWLLNMSPLHEAALAYSQLEKYMRDMIQSEKQNIAEIKDHQSEARGNLLTSLLRVSAAGNSEGTIESRKKAFSENEVIGNLFIFLIAGYETTSNVVLYGLIVLAIRPDIQEKVMAEVDKAYVDASNDGRDQLSYAQDFEKFQYTYGFMYEMFRQFPGVTQITKMVHTPTNIVVSQQGSVAPSHYTLPAQCRVYLSCPGTNYSPHYWPSPLEVDPHRWDEVRHTNENSSDSSGSTHSKNVVAADRARQMRGTFLTFSDGQRSCLGRKFAQAEYIAFLATLLRDYKVVLGKGEDPKRVAQDVYLRSAGKITLAPLDSVKLELEKRTR